MQITFINLHPYYVYQCVVAAYTIGIGPYTLPVTVQLAQEGLFSIINLVLLNIVTFKQHQLHHH